MHMAFLGFDKRMGVIAVLSVLGIVCMSYLLSLHFEGASSSAFCNFGAGFSCQIVNQSLYAEVAGVPVAALGLVYFAGVIGLVALRDRVPYSMRLLFLGTLGLLVFSLYLSVVELTVLRSICLFCEGSKVLMLAIAALAYGEARRRGHSFAWFEVLAVLAAGGTLVYAVRTLQGT